MMTPMRHIGRFLSSSLTVVAGTILILFLLLHRNEGPSDPLNQEILQVYHLTVPGSGQIVEALNTVWRPEYASARWEFKMDSSWTSYKEWIARNLPEGYQDVQKSESLLRFRKVLLGDVYRMDIQKLTSRNSVGVRVEFLAVPF
jgi:hypothetical protein